MNSDDSNKHPITENVIGYEHFHKRLDLLMEAYKSPRAFAIACGISQSGLSRITSGGYPTLPVLVDIAKANDVSLDWLVLGISSQSNNTDVASSLYCDIHDNAGNAVDLNEFSFIPRYNVTASAGHGCDIGQESFMFSMAYRTYWIKKFLEVNPKDLIALTARGDSMMGVIDDRDVMIIDTANKSLSDGIYVLRLDGDLLVKRAQKLPNQVVRISSANPVYEPFEIDMTNPPNDFDVIGAVVHTEPGTLFRYRKN